MLANKESEIPVEKPLSPFFNVICLYSQDLWCGRGLRVIASIIKDQRSKSNTN